MRAIDLDKALLAVCSGCNEEFSEEPCEPGCCRIREKLENAPTLTIDNLRPKGRWEPVDARYSRCTNCKRERNIRTQIGWEFCPSCGADMRGGGEDG